jgi:GTP-binding protein HflX
MTDTVGFIRKLPHHLVAPFRSTLEEAADADLVLHLVDGAHANRDDHLVVGEEVLDGLGVDRDRTLVVVNKIDLLPDGRPAAMTTTEHGVPVSAVTGAGVEELRSAIRHRLLSAPGVAFLRVPLEEADMVARAIQLPHQLAKRFRERSVEIAMRVDGRRLTDAGLDPFRVEEWEYVGSDGGANAGV